MLVPTGIAVHLANSSLAAIILPRSGPDHKHAIVLGNLVGLIDSDYQDEIMVSTWNRCKDSFTLNPLDRLAQLVVVQVLQVAFNVVDEFDASTRGDVGFGSTGKSLSRANMKRICVFCDANAGDDPHYRTEAASVARLEGVDSMHTRKVRMTELSDDFIALPGGFGTFEEFCEILTCGQLGFHSKPMGLLNIKGY